MEEEIKALMELLLPDFLVDHFTLVKTHKTNTIIDIYLDEKPTVPKELEGLNLISHGFHKIIKVSDFPIRGRQVNLFIKRRRWLNKDTNEVVSRNWKLIAEGTRMTAEFAAFLKGFD